MDTLEVRGRRVGALTWGRGERLALCLHGFPDEPGAWRPVAETLVQRGYTVCAPALRGYAPTAPAADGDYGPRALAGDVLALADHLGHPTFDLVGHDWGALVTYATCNLAPQRVRRAVALSVPPPAALRQLLGDPRRALPQLWRSRYMAWFQVPGLSEALVRTHGHAYLRRLWRRWSPGFEPPAARFEAVSRGLAEPGALTAALSYYRALSRPSLWRRDAALVTAPISTPTLVLAGQRDGCIDVSAYGDLDRAFSGPWRFEAVPGVGHFLIDEAPQRVGDLIVAWLTGDASGEG
jgi:pimeloyl-ACP methyl ester carboxylesterase